MCTEKSIEELMINAKCKSSADYEKQMKIVKAVAELGCDKLGLLNRLCLTHVARATEFNSIYDEDSFHFVTLLEKNKYWEFICTIAEYNQCIEEMKYHYDIPKWCSYNRANKELLSVENSDQGFYEKEKFVYGQDVYINEGEWKNKLMKFGCFTLDSKKALLLYVDGNGFRSVDLESISSKPFKSKEDIELEEFKYRQVIEVASIIGSWIEVDKRDDPISIAHCLQGKGYLAEIILPLEKS